MSVLKFAPFLPGSEQCLGVDELSLQVPLSVAALLRLCVRKYLHLIELSALDDSAQCATEEAPESRAKSADQLNVAECLSPGGRCMAPEASTDALSIQSKLDLKSTSDINESSCTVNDPVTRQSAGEEGPSMAEALRTRCWEQLHTGHWSCVPVVWRHLYSISCLFLCVEHLRGWLCSCNNDTQQLRAALLCCDMALIMGAPLRASVLTKLASLCHDRLSAAVGDNYDDLASLDTPQPPPAVTLSCPLPRFQCPSLETFCTRIVGRTAAVLHGCCESWPALGWTLRSLCVTAGHRTVPVELGVRYTDTAWSQQLMLLGQFVRRHVATDVRPSTGYLAQYELLAQVPELGTDVRVPDYCHVPVSDDEEVEKEGARDVHVNVWLGPSGTISPLHHDPRHNCLVQVFGYKYVRVMAPCHSHRLYPHQSPLLSNTSRVDVDNPDTCQFPLYAGTPYMEAVLGPGDLLYMPPHWWHYVRSQSVSCSVSHWFG